MEFLSEDPTYLAGGLGLTAAAFLVALRVTQQGKYLVWAGLALGLALLVLAVEKVWVTDNERIEAAVYDLGRAVERSDPDAVLDRLTPDVRFVLNSVTAGADQTRAWVARSVASSHFDFLRISRLRANAGGESRRGTAEFKVLAGGSTRGSVNDLNFGSLNSSWSLGLRETGAGVWKVERITPLSFPWNEIPGTAPGQGRSRSGPR